jgi:hypothetical protein
MSMRRTRSVPSIAIALALALAASCYFAEPPCYAESATDTAVVANAAEPAPLTPLAPVRVEVALTGAIAQPFEGAHSLGDWGFGLMLALGVQWRNWPLKAGFDITGIRFGRATSTLEAQLGDSSAELEETRLDQTIFLDSWLRLQPDDWPLRPYVEGVLGLKFLDTKYSLAFPNGTGETSTVTDQASASTFGWGLGLDVLLGHASDDTGSALYATLGVRELAGSRASFSRAPDSNAANQTLRFDVPTRSTVFLLGFAVHLQHRTQRTDRALGAGQ